MKKILLALAMCICLFGFSARAEINATKAESFVKEVTNDGIENIINANISQAAKDKRFEALFDKALDLDFIGQFVLGRYWKNATPAQRKGFLAAYRNLNTVTWSKRFDEFKGKKFVFDGTTPSNSKGQIFVNSLVPMDQGEPAKVVWRVKDTNGTYKIVDIIIENVSIAITARNEYTAFVRNNDGDIDALISDIKAKTK